MKFPYAMLRDFVQTELTAVELGELLTMAGFELEGTEEVDGDSVLDIKVMSNRGDGLSVFGLSREVLAKDPRSLPTDLYVRAAQRFVGVDHGAGFNLETSAATVEAEECNRFAVRGFRGVSGQDQSPEWMQKRLNQVGMRPISLLVDLTNYVMLELGQPLHSFDRQKLVEARIVVRLAKPGEKLTTLNGEEHELSGQMMICDAMKPVGVPGVMGGLETEVTDNTEEVLLESANFRNITVRKTRKQLGLATEASYRFERSVDPDGVVAAIHRFTELLLSVRPDIVVSDILDLYPRPPVRTPVEVRVSRVSMLLGMTVTNEEAIQYLSRLGMMVTPLADGRLSVVPPSWRPDIIREEDLVEEIGRVHGFDRIPETLPEGSTTLGGPLGIFRQIDIARDSLLRSGLSQMISHSLRAKGPLDAVLEIIGPRNPASPEHAVLRNSLLPGLADAARRNGGRDLHLFEIGKVFGRVEEAYIEKSELAVLTTGALSPIALQNEKAINADFFSLKAIVEGLGRDLGIPLGFESPSEESIDIRLHPFRQAIVTQGVVRVGFLGQIHPDIAAELDLVPETYLGCLEIESLLRTSTPSLTLKSISRNPAVGRDIAILISRSVSYASIEKAIESAGGEVLERQRLFDVYDGQGIPEGMHSIGIGLQFRKFGKNFTDEEANQVRDRIVAALGELGATLR